jgi:hypothetical protein
MTIVIQHQYWGLEIEANGFYVTLSFSDSQERIYVPFAALLSFMDPYAKFGLQFTPSAFVAQEDVSSQGTPLKENPHNVITLDTFRKK